MSEAKLGTGFRFEKLAAWTPAVALAVAMVALIMGAYWVAGGLVILAALIWLLVSRRKKQMAASAASPPADRPAMKSSAPTTDG